MINMDFYAPILDSTNKVTIELMEDNTSRFPEVRTINLWEDGNRPNFGFCSAINMLQEKIKFDTTFFNPIKQHTRYRLTVAGRGIAGGTICDNGSVASRFKSMFVALDTKTTIWLYMNSIGELAVDFCYTTFYPREGVLKEQIETYWDDELVTYIDSFVKSKDETKENKFLCDIFMEGSVSGWIRNVEVNPYSISYKLLKTDLHHAFGNFPFHFDGTINMENGTHFYHEIDYRKIHNKRPFDPEAKSYFERTTTKYKDSKPKRSKPSKKKTENTGEGD